jgi:hypothetical protein
LKHAESVRRQKQIEADMRKRNDKTDEDIFKKMEELEMAEELAQELENLEIEDDEMLDKLMKGKIEIPKSKTRIAHNLENPESTELSKSVQEIDNVNTNISNGLSTIESRTSTPYINNDLITKSNNEVVQLLKAYRGKIRDVLKGVNRSDEGSLNLYVDLVELIDDIDDDIVKIRGEEDESEEMSDSDDLTATMSIEGEEEPTRKRKVRFSTSLEDVKIFESASSETYSECSTCSDSSSDNQTIDIKFTHSDAKLKAVNDPDLIVSHPGEIKSKFSKSSSQQSQIATKSILKRTLSSEPTTPTENGSVKKIFQSDIPVIGDVLEHEKIKNDKNVVIVAAKDEIPKKVSKFRQMRSLKS